MSKIQLFITRANEILEEMEYSKLGSLKYRKEIQDKLVKAFSETYGEKRVAEHDCVEDNGFALVPATLLTKGGTEYLAFLKICVQDSGVLYDTDIFHPQKGIVSQNDFEQKLDKEEYESMFPYKYKPLICIVGDIHTGSYY
ncbi:hypothetical protein [Bacillus thuringiensis]|uniref:hypothetical protein n=1 Tax=Bacillus thuringiensis TaxID=1428 RepID=UPI0021D65248|nr:hypothetical protein [Bacillus thuringiensis]MCU7666788.1 hypothetical protein [Bacillus thuringiensis]